MNKVHWKKIFPRSITKKINMVLNFIEDSFNAKRTSSEIFSEIYKKGKWGKVSERPFCSGDGTINKHIISPYIDAINNYLSNLDYSPVVVDLGCGDMSIGRSFISVSGTYKGVDVVPDLIKWHKEQDYGTKVYFDCLDVSKDKLPDGDICLIRQVLQHLSNEQIGEILPKLDKYKVIFITEHQPSAVQDIVPNKDMITGSKTRIAYMSGVFVDKEPFGNLLLGRSIEKYLQVPVNENTVGNDSDVIVTYKIE